MAKAKKMKPPVAAAKWVSERLGLIEAKVESTIVNLGTANKRIDELTAAHKGLRADFECSSTKPAKPADVSVRVMPVDELVEYIKLHYSHGALKKLITALVWIQT